MSDEMNEDLDKRIEDFIATAELIGETCCLKHSEADPAENHQAIDYLCQKIGNPKDGSVFYELRIPICEECMEALSDKDWILMYCVNCNNSQWVKRTLAKRNYPAGNLIYWLDVCPFCAEVADDKKFNNTNSEKDEDG